MCIAIGESYLSKIGGSLPLGDLRLVMDDGQELNEFGIAVREATTTQPGGYEGEELFEGAAQEPEIGWVELVERLRCTEWQPLEAVMPAFGTSRTNALYLNRAFGLHKVRTTKWLCNARSNYLACLCQEGVFLFGTEIEFSCLIAKRLTKALRMLLGSDFDRREGPIRVAGRPYDPYGEDELEDRLDQDECESGDEYVDEFDYQPEPIDITLYRGIGVWI